MGATVTIGQRLAVVLLVLTATAIASATSINANFCSVANVQNPPAGVVPAMTWNDFTAVAGFGGFGSSNNVLYEDGSLSGATATWGGSAGVSQNTNDNVNRLTDIDDGHDELMTGYLQASKFGPQGYVPTVTLDVSNLNVAAFGGTYSVILYFDGDGDVSGLTGATTFSVNDGVNPVQLVYGRDANVEYALVNNGTNPLAVYQQITSTDPLNPTLGNYVRFDGLTGSSFSATIAGIANEQGAALNGFQIVPEPTAALLLAALAGVLRRR